MLSCRTLSDLGIEHPTSLVKFYTLKTNLKSSKLSHSQPLTRSDRNFNIFITFFYKVKQLPVKLPRLRGLHMRFKSFVKTLFVSTVSLSLVTTISVPRNQAATQYTEKCVREIWDNTGLNYAQAHDVCENATLQTSSCVIELWNLPDRPFISDIISQCK